MPPKKCFSKCRKIPQAECNSLDKCTFVAGKTRKYCRLQNKYKMDADCHIIDKISKAKTRKIIKKQQSASAELLQKQVKAKDIITRFMQRTKHKRKAVFLKALCNDAGVCIAFGTYAAEIKKHFGGFIHFEYAVNPVTMIGTPSGSGFINEIKYEHRGYESYAILKSSQNPASDNLLYEYMVGQYVNKLNKRFPCFLETYGYYKYNTDADWLEMKNTRTKPVALLKNGLTLHKTVDYALACTDSKYLAILIQHLKGIQSVKSMLYNNEFIIHDLLQVLYQIYIPLYLCRDTFTHYDLHPENVILYQPAKNGYVQFHYHIAGQIVSFKSKYVAKIIDYGRCFFKDETIEAKDIYKKVCAEKECKPVCGTEKGFGWLAINKPNSYNYWISSQKNNKSHDLRLLNEIKLSYKNLYEIKQISIPIFTLLTQVKYNHQYGTPVSKPAYPKKIQTIEDAATMLTYYVTHPVEISNNDAHYAYYTRQTKFGDLHIYADGQPMRFIKA
jgi:hypothetical protein